MSDEALNVMQAAQSYESVDSAVDAMFEGKTDADVQDNAQARAPDGKFEGKKPAEVVDIKTAKPVEAKQEQAADDDDDFEWEIPAEKEGEAPRRVKARETFAAYEELPKVKAELDALKKGAPIPADYLALNNETMQKRGKLIEHIEVLEGLINPVRPDPNQYVDDPEAYRQAQAGYENSMRRLGALRQAKEREIENQKEAQSVAIRAQIMKATEEVIGFWPEMKDDATRNPIIEKASKLTGFSPEEILGTLDPRMWKVLKGYIEYESSREKQAEAVKVARQKPKLVKGTARQATTTADVRRNSALDRFSKSRSVDDAIEALLG